MMTAKEIRESFKKFFESKGHQIVPSAPMVVKDDPTLMFTNAGMNQWKDIILGTRDPEPRRRADSQKCLRVSGKHNDLCYVRMLFLKQPVHSFTDDVYLFERFSRQTNYICVASQQAGCETECKVYRYIRRSTVKYNPPTKPFINIVIFHFLLHQGSLPAPETEGGYIWVVPILS